MMNPKDCIKVCSGLEKQGVSKKIQTIKMIMFYYRDKQNGGHLEYIL